MFTKLKDTTAKLSLYILVFVMFGLAIWLNIYAVDSINEDLAILTDSEPTITILETKPKLYRASQDEYIHNTTPLSGPELYLYYVDRITTEIYPDIPYEYVVAIIWHESRFHPDSVNKDTGVKGLMQISPKWHTQRANDLGVYDLLDPYGNILVGCDILNELTQQYGFRYALNHFAGGYKYANAHKNSVSRFEKELETIISQIDSGEIVIGGE